MHINWLERSIILVQDKSKLVTIIMLNINPNVCMALWMATQRYSFRQARGYQMLPVKQENASNAKQIAWEDM